MTPGIVNEPLHFEKRKTIKFGRFEVSLTVANLFFAFLAIAGQVGQNVSLPLWIDSTIVTPYGDHLNDTNSNIIDRLGRTVHLPETSFVVSTDFITNRTNSSSGSGHGYQPRVDAFFVFAFACISFVVIFGTTLLFVRLFQPHRLGETERKFPHLQLFLVGLFDALNGVLVVFASSGSRTAPYLQAILGNFMIPLTMAFR